MAAGTIGPGSRPGPGPGPAGYSETATAQSEWSNITPLVELPCRYSWLSPWLVLHSGIFGIRLIPK